LASWIFNYLRQHVVIDMITGKSRAYAFLDASGVDAQAAIGALNGTALDNQFSTDKAANG
jgi:hypothetical protein